MEPHTPSKELFVVETHGSDEAYKTGQDRKEHKYFSLFFRFKGRYMCGNFMRKHLPALVKQFCQIQ